MGYQITVDSGATLSLGFSTVAAEDASTVLDVTVDLREMTDLNCEEKEEDKDHMFRTLLSKLTSVMTDRAAVMKRLMTNCSAFFSLDFVRMSHSTLFIAMPISSRTGSLF